MKIDKKELHNIFNGIAAKEESKFELLYDRYNKLVYQIAFSILKNKENSEDVVQKVFLKIWKLDKEKLPTCNESSWLYSLVKNESLNFLKSKKEEIDLDDLYYITDDNTELNEIIDKDSYNRIISRLNPDEQEIVSLKLLSSLSFREISEILNIPIGTVQWKYYKTMNTLKILITNFSMFVIAIGLFLSERRVSKSKKSGQAQENITINNENSLKLTESIKNKDNDRISLGETSSDIKKNNVFDEKLENKNQINRVTNNETVEMNQINSNETKELNALELGTLTISLIFFIITLICCLRLVRGRRRKKVKSI